MARLARDDVNMPNFDSFPIDVQVSEVKFEVAAYDLLRSEPNILASHLLYHRIPVQHAGPKLDVPQNIAGRRLFLFERTEGEKNIWLDLSPDEKVRACGSHLRRSIQSGCVILPYRIVFLLSRHVSAHHCSATIFRSNSLLFGSVNASLSRSLNHSPFPLPLLVSSALVFSRPRSMQQSGTWVT